MFSRGSQGPAFGFNFGGVPFRTFPAIQLLDTNFYFRAQCGQSISQRLVLSDDGWGFHTDILSNGKPSDKVGRAKMPAAPASCISIFGMVLFP